MSTAPIRVLYLDHTAALGGGELALARLLGALDRERVDPFVVLAQEGPLRDLLARQSVDTEVVPLGEQLRAVRKDTLGIAGLARQAGSLSALLRYARRISRLARQRGAQLIYTNSLKSDLYGALAARLAGVPVIWHIRDRVESGYLPPAAAWLMRALAARVPACVVANSASTLATLKLPSRRRTAVIASGLTREHIERCAAQRRGNSVPRIGIVGRLAPWKGQDVFLEAAAQLSATGIAANFVIAGSALFGEESFERRLREHAVRLGLSDRVEFLGFCDVPAVLGSLDILVHASRIPEPFGQVIIEGMAAALPVIATDGGGAREIIESGRTGLLVPMSDARSLADALAQLLSQPELARRLGAAGYQHVLENFTIERSARQSEALYEELLRSYT